MKGSIRKRADGRWEGRVELPKKENWQPCPRCGSNKVKSVGIAYLILMGLGTFSVGFWVMLFIPFIGIALMIAGVALCVLAPFSKGVLQCQDCKKSWKYKPEQISQ